MMLTDYMSRKERRRGLTSTEDSVDTSIQWLENYIQKCGRRLIEKETLRETESLLIAAQNNAIKINHIKARIDKMQQNNKCRLCGDRDKTINHIIGECSKLAQKEYKTRHDWVSKVIHWKMYKKFKFDHRNKWYLYNPTSVLENDTHKLLWNSDIQWIT